MFTGRKRAMVIAVLAALIVLTWAWIDGGKREPGPMVEEVPVPDTVK